ncbi:energy transducer TonB [Mucilaginibacter panaciglaebae]|uniref:TonB C-terminal domain-containing protein n=1 Tax=Mucilaginibacter panaciglaebae TaxID=502331 RepID=A0ABP7WIS4_9SPHI
MKPITLILLLCGMIFTNSFAQSHSITTLFKNNGRQVYELDSADFARVVSEPDSGSKLFNVNEYYINKTPRLVAKSWNRDNMQFEGQAVWFYPNGRKQELCNFHEARKKGDAYEYYPNGKLYIHKKYLWDDEKIAGNNELFLDYQDSTGKVLATNGEGYYKIYNNNFSNVFEEGKVKNGLRDGEWKGDNGAKDHHITFTESYDNGTLKSGRAVHVYENKTYDYTTRSVMPQFFGGLPAFGNYLSQNIHYPGVSRFNHTQGRVIVTFVVLADGSLAEFQVKSSPDILMSKEAVRVLAASPAWVPGYQFGKAVRVSYTVPINFTL